MTTMIARTVTDGRDGHSLIVPHADLLTTAVRALHATRQLSHLADHMLKDIGLSRSILINASMRRAREEEEIRRRLNAY